MQEFENDAGQEKIKSIKREDLWNWQTGGTHSANYSDRANADSDSPGSEATIRQPDTANVNTDDSLTFVGFSDKTLKRFSLYTSCSMIKTQFVPTHSIAWHFAFKITSHSYTMALTELAQERISRIHHEANSLMARIVIPSFNDTDEDTYLPWYMLSYGKPNSS